MSLRMKRCVIYLFCTSMFILLLSCSLLLKIVSDSPQPDPVLMLMFVNGTKLLPAGADSGTSNSVKPKPTPAIPSAETRWRWNGCHPDQAILKVYMYDLPSKFHFGLLGWQGNEGDIWPNVTDVVGIPRYPGGLNLQHSIEYWLTLDMLSSNSPSTTTRPCFAVRVNDSSLADVVFVPFFSSLCYNRLSKVQGKGKQSRNKLLQDELVEYLMARKEWKRWDGRDHVILAHHPNSMHTARRKLKSARFVLSDFGRYRAEIANVGKDVIAPYKHLVRSLVDDSPPFDARPILAYFRGAIYRKDGGVIRARLYHLLRREKDVYFASGSAQNKGIAEAGKGMASSKFCLSIAGDTPSSNRLFDAIVSHCVPVIISDDVELPFEDDMDYSEFCVFVRASDAVTKGFLVGLLRGVDRREWTTMWGRLRQVAHHFEYHHPSQPGDAVQMTWEAIARKVNNLGSSSGDLLKHKANRYRRTQTAS